MLKKTALLVMLVVGCAVSAAAQSPNYGSGFTASGLTLNGGAAISGTRLRLTDGGTAEARSAFFNTPVNVQQFTNTFTFQDTAGSSTADGLTFTIQNNAATALGVGGGSLGYGPTSSSTGGIPNSVAVKFDLYSNAGEGPDSTGLYSDGVSPTVPAVDMSGSGVDLHSGDIFSVTMSYNGTTLTMQITDTVTNATFSTSFTVNIPGVVGANTAFVGFTGGTGGLTATQDILTWTYTPTGGGPVAPTITTQPSNQTVSVGQTATFTVVASGTAPLTYQWMQNTGSGYSNISGANSASYTTPATSSGNNGTTFEVTVTNGQGSATSNPATLTVTAAGTTPSYGSGFTSSGLTLNGGAALSGTRLRLTDGGTGEARSAFFNTPVNVQQFTNTFTFQLTSGSSTADGFTFTIQNNSSTSLGGGGGSLGYGPTSGTTGGIPNSVAVKFDLYSNAGEGTDSTGLYTNGVSPTVPAVDMSSSRIDLHSGDTFSVTMTYNGTTLTMQITDTVTKATFSTSFTVNIPGVVGGSNAYVGFTGGTGGLTATQDILTWTYTPTGGSPVPPTITTQPSNQTVSANQTATFTVVASGTPTLTYQWAQNTGSGYSNISGATSASYTTPPTTSANNGTTFEVTVTNGQGSATSNPATLTVSTTPPTITTQPSNQTVSANQTATFTVVASGTAPLTYQWMQNTGTGYSNISGATSASYTTPPTTVANSGTTFEVKVTNGQGSVTSNAATLTVTAAGSGPSYGGGFTSSGLTLNGGAAISGTRLRVTDGGTGEARSAFYSTPVNVQQFTNTFTFQDTAGSSTADGLTFTIQNNAATALGVGGGSLGYGPTSSSTGGIPNSVAVKFDLYSNAGEGPDSTGLYSDGVSPTVPAVDMSGSGVDLHSGDIFSVTMSYNGTTLTMQITDTVTNATFSTSFTVNIPGVVGANTAFVGFTGGTGGLTATQDILTWTYTPTGGGPVAPTITTQPSNQTVSVGQTATFTVVASGTAPLTYQWMQNTGSGYSNISGANSASYTTPATSSGNNGTTFEVTVTNGQGSATSNPATLTVTAAGTTPSYGSGFTSSGLTLNGGAALSGTRLRLTDGGTGEARSAFFDTTVNVQSFITDFTFQLTNATADGFTFTIQNNSPTALGVGGGSLGYGPTSTNTGGIPNSVAVKFDLYSNAGEGSDSTGLYTDGASPTLPSVDMSNSGINLHSGDVMTAHIAYDGATLTLIITDTSTLASFKAIFAVNVPGVIGANTGYVGFTGGTGGSSATQDILTWRYNPVPVTAFQWPVNTPITYALSANGGNNDYSTFALQSPILGQYHTGIDVCPQSPGCAVGNPVFATSSGIVELALVVSDPTETLCDGSSTSGYQINPSSSNLGNVIVIAHPNGKFSLYGHLDCIQPGIVPGLQVSAGTQIANMGHSGDGDRDRTFEPHTHFEIKERAVTGDPSNLGYSGYTPDLPDGYGYHDARIFISPFSSTAITPIAVKVGSTTQNITTGPTTSFATLGTIAAGQEFVAFASSGSWYEIYMPNDNAPVAGWIAQSGVTADSGATLLQVSGASGSGLTVQAGASGSASLVSWDETFGDCSPTAQIFNGQMYVSAGSQSGFNEFYLPLNYYINSTGTCAEPSGPGPTKGWASSTFLH